MDSKQILTTLDKLFANGQMEEIEPFLLGQLQEAMEEEDTSCVLTVLNELIGHYRETSQHEKGILFAERTKTIAKGAGLEGTLSYAIILLNVANEYRACGRLEDSLEEYKEAKKIYDSTLSPTDFSYAAFYNNLGLLYQEMGEFALSVESLQTSLDVVVRYENTRIQQASTHTNLGASLFHWGKEHQAEALLHIEHAFVLFDQDEKKNYHYAAALDVMGDIQKSHGRMAQALSFYKKAMELTKLVMGENYGYQRIVEKIKDLPKVTTEKVTKGLDLSYAFYVEKIAPMIHERFPQMEDRIAVGLVGLGSECYGYDDAISRDHDWGKGVILWLLEDDYNNIGQSLEEAYQEVVAREEDFVRIETPDREKRVGVCSMGTFYGRILELPTAEVTQAIARLQKGEPIFNYDTWEKIGQERLSKGTNGRIFKDTLGVFTRFYEALVKEYPEPLWRARLAQGLSDMAHKGQYNFKRVILRKDKVTATLILSDFCKDTMQVVYLLNHVYPPYYKWTYRGIFDLPYLSQIGRLLEELLALDNPSLQEEMIEMIARSIINELHRQGLTDSEDAYLEVQANEVFEKRCGNYMEENDKIIEDIVSMEWKCFDKVKGQGGRASCQDDYATFSIMRKSQYLVWDLQLLQSYEKDLTTATKKGWNLISEKYARMMEYTNPEEYETLSQNLPVVTKEKRAIVDQIASIVVEQMESFAQEYPYMAGNARVIRTNDDTAVQTSYETYLKGELLTYSDETLVLYGRFVVRTVKEGKNIAFLTMEETAKLYGYEGVADAEEKMKKTKG